MIQPTTALRKLVRLKKRIWVVQGGQGAAKTFSILIIIANHARSCPNKEIFIASQELTKMRITIIKDFVKILKAIGIYDDRNFIAGTLYRFENGSFIKFIGLDKEDLGKGLRSDLVFVNEANKTTFETFRELTSRARRVIVDFNPNGEFWAHTELMSREDVDFLVLTFLDNEFLSREERYEIELYKKKAYHNPDLEVYDTEDNVKNKYWRNKWVIYGLGQVGTSPNRIFFWEEIADEKYLSLDAVRYYGVDWGTVDPWGIIECKYYDGALYFHEKNYASENEIKEHLKAEEWDIIARGHDPDDPDNEGGIVKFMFNKLQIPKSSYIVCDTNRPMKIMALHKGGWEYAIAAPKPPGSIIDGIDLLNGLRCYYTSSSKNIKYENENYCRQVDRYGKVLEEPEDINNHLKDPSRYIALFLSLMGIIKR
jgi:phage terminase large subunit